MIVQPIHFSYSRLEWCWLGVLDLQGLCLVVLPLIVDDCLKLQHYCLDIIGNFHFIFIDCNYWSILFFQFDYSMYHKAVSKYRVTYAYTLAPWEFISSSFLIFFEDGGNILSSHADVLSASARVHSPRKNDCRSPKTSVWEDSNIRPFRWFIVL